VPVTTELACITPFRSLTLFGPHAMSELSPLSGAKRKLDFGTVRTVFDPKLSCATRRVCDAAFAHALSASAIET
jgi:hypothetical protein